MHSWVSEGQTFPSAWKGVSKRVWDREVEADSCRTDTLAHNRQLPDPRQAAASITEIPALDTILVSVFVF